jgi:hypothetical protein
MWHWDVIIMSSWVLQVVFCILGIMLQLVAMYYAGRPVVRALQRRKMNELPKLDAAIAQLEPTPAAARHELPCVPAAPKNHYPVSAVPERKEPAVRPGLLTKTEKVHFIR